MKTFTQRLAAAGAGVVAAGCASLFAGDSPDVSGLMRESFAERGIAKLDRLDQSPLQKTCSEYAGRDLPADLRANIERAEVARIRYPADGRFLGDWRRGEAVAQSGRGMQFSDAAGAAGGGNCYACHQLTKTEVSYGNIGPSLNQYGKLRGTSEPIVRYTWAKIWNSHAFNACTNMPRFGDAGILTEAQIKDLMALLLDPASPVNRD
jgi:sulfur-oxidizing protein SoxX